MPSRRLFRSLERLLARRVGVAAINWPATEAVASNALLVPALTRSAATAVTSAALPDASWPTDAKVSATFRETVVAPSTASVVTLDALIEALRRAPDAKSVTVLDPAFSRSVAAALAFGTPSEASPTPSVARWPCRRQPPRWVRALGYSRSSGPELPETVELLHVIFSDPLQRQAESQGEGSRFGTTISNYTSRFIDRCSDGSPRTRLNTLNTRSRRLRAGRGESPGPAPAAQARANNWRLTRSS